jgi:hypothetical protein
MFAVAMATGCNLSEDISECVVCNINVRFTYNSDNVDKLIDDVHDIRIYVFEKDSRRLVRIIDASQQDIVRGWIRVDDLPAGRYDLSAWASSGENLFGGGFMEVEMDDAATSSYRPLMDDDETLIDDFYIMIDHDLLPAEEIGDVASKEAGFNDLFHASVDGFELKKGESQTVDFDLIRNANVLNVSVTGHEHIATRAMAGSGDRTRAGEVNDLPFDLFVVGRNGRYRWDNSIDQNARLVRYRSPATVWGAELRYGIKTLRLDLARHSVDPILLHVTDSEQGWDLITPIDVIAALGQVKDGEGNYMYATQEQLDRAYEFPIEIVVTPIENTDELKVRLFINDWEIVDLVPEV